MRAVVVLLLSCCHAVVVILYVARYLVTVTAREHGGEQRECRLQSHFVVLVAIPIGCKLGATTIGAAPAGRAQTPERSISGYASGP